MDSLQGRENKCSNKRLRWGPIPHLRLRRLNNEIKYGGDITQRGKRILNKPIDDACEKEILIPTKRVITVEAEYDLTDPELIGAKITDRDIVEELVKDEFITSFKQNDGFVSLTVTCSDY